MAKYRRYDPRNKKKDRHKNQYLDRSPKKQRKEYYIEFEAEENDMSKMIKDYR